jgi:acyl carrier protein
MSEEEVDRVNDVTQRLQRVFREVLDDPELELSDGMTAAQVPGWDSLAHVSLMFSVESEFGITFSDTELSGMADVGELRRTVLAKTAA